jgi:hypothetical protein
MEVELIQTQAIVNTLDSTREFGVFLLKSLSIVRMLHWYASDYNTHIILGDLYESLDPLFNKLQKEIIGTIKEYSESNAIFPMLAKNSLDLDNIENFRDGNYNSYYLVYKTLTETLTSIEFNNFLTQVKSGLSNTVEEIISSLNKANYLISLTNKS